MEIVLGHWDAWDDDALIVDKTSGRFADPTKVRRLDYEGKYYRSRGPFTVPRSEQGHPAIIQAGQSGRGMAHRGRWAGPRWCSRRAAMRSAPRKPTYLACWRRWRIAAATPTMSRSATPSSPSSRLRKRGRMAEGCDGRDSMKLPLEIDQLSLLAEGVEHRFRQPRSRRAADRCRARRVLQRRRHFDVRDSVIRASGKKNPSTRDFIDINHRGKVTDAAVGGS